MGQMKNIYDTVINNDSVMDNDEFPFSARMAGDKCVALRQWMTTDPLYYNLLKENARANRNNMTEAESAF